MKINAHQEGTALVVACHEQRLDAKLAVEFKTTMTSYIEKGNRTLVLNLTEVEFIDSSALGAIVSTLKLLGRDGDLLIAGAQETIARVFSLTRMDRVFKMFPGVEEALESLT